MSISTNIGVNVQQRRGKRPGRKEIPDHDKEEIFRLAEHERLSTAEIARRVGRDSRTVRRHLGDRARTLSMAPATVARDRRHTRTSIVGKCGKAS